MLIDINSLFSDVLQTQEQRRAQLTQEGLVRAQQATQSLSPDAAFLAPLLSSYARTAPARSDAIRGALTRLTGGDARTESQRLQGLLSGLDVNKPESVETLKEAGYGAQAAQLQQMQQAAMQQQAELTSQQALREAQQGLVTAQTEAQQTENRLADRRLEIQEMQVQAQLQNLGFEAADRAAQREIARENARLRAEEIELQRERNIALAQQITDQTRRMIADSTNEALSSRGSAITWHTLAKRYQETPPRAGFFGSAVSAFKTFLGTQGNEDDLRREYIRIRNENMMASLPPGAASDADVALAQQGWPAENANAEYLSQFMSGQAKLSAINAELNAMKSRYLNQNNGNIAGFFELWNETIQNPEFVAGLEEKYNISFSPDSSAVEAQEERAELLRTINERASGGMR